MMDRRSFLLASLAGSLTAPVSAWPQQTGKVWRIGYLSAFPRTPGLPYQLDVLLYRLRELGYVEGKNLVVEARFSEGRAGRSPTLAAELVAANVDVILALGNWGTGAAKQATSTIPIVMLGGVDPVRAGLVASLARPGGNVTGLVQDVEHTVLIKQLELLRELVPRNSRIAVVVAPQQKTSMDAFELLKPAATTLEVTLHPILIQSPDDFEAAFAAIIRERADALFVLPNPSILGRPHPVLDFAVRRRIPATYWWSVMVRLGGLMAYGVDWADLFGRAATYVDKIFKGAKPAGLPIGQPTKFELLINLKTAKTLGLTIPQSLLLRADRVIE